MLKKLVMFILLSSFAATAQTSAPQPTADDFQSFEQQILLSTVLIDVKGIGTGTGFIVAVPVPSKSGNKNVTFLISNAHVFLGLKQPTTVKIHGSWLPGMKPNLEKSDSIEIQGAKFFAHPDGKTDLACAVISSFVGDRTVISTPLDMLSDFTEATLTVGRDISYVGYPSGYYDEAHNLPLLRRGYIASAPKIDFNGLPMFVIDAQVVGGSSGSPVFSQVGPNGTMKLIGVVTEQVSQNTLVIQKLSDPAHPIVLGQTIGLGNVIKATEVRKLIDFAMGKMNDGIKLELSASEDEKMASSKK